MFLDPFFPIIVQNESQPIQYIVFCPKSFKEDYHLFYILSEIHPSLLFYTFFINFKTLFYDKMNIIDIPVSKLIPPEERKEFVGTHIRAIHHEEIDTEETLRMISSRESPPVDLKLDVMIDSTIRY